jgi:hypothetical protein
VNQGASIRAATASKSGSERKPLSFRGELPPSRDESDRSVARRNAPALAVSWSQSFAIKDSSVGRQSPFNLAAQFRCHGQLVPRSPDELHLHPALVRLNLIHSVVELSKAIRLKNRCHSEPIRITTHGTIIAGFSDWHEALSDGRPLVDCIEYPLSDEEALESILVNHQPRRTWNRFNRVRVALELEPYFQKKALTNQVAGGKYKGSAILPKAEHTEVREEIAVLAGVSARTVSNVKTILENAAPGIKDALQTGTLTINRALQWCSLPQWKQIEQFTHYLVERTHNKAIQHSLAQVEVGAMGRNVGAILDALQQKEAREPGSVLVEIGKRQHTVILLGQDVLSCPTCVTELANA